MPRSSTNISEAAMAKKPNLADLLTANAQSRSGSGGAEIRSRLISVYDIAPSVGNFYDVSDIAGLKQSIELIGLQQDLVVKTLGGGKYEVISGHRRLRACRELADEGKNEYQRVPCKISAATDGLLERLALIMTNSTTRQLSDWEQVRQASELREVLSSLKARDGISGRVRDLVAEVMNSSATKIGRLDAIDRNLSPEFKAELENGNIAITTAYEISGLPVGAQADAYAEYKAQGTVTVERAKARKHMLPASTPAAQTMAEPPRKTLFEQITASPLALAEYLRKIQACPNYSCPQGREPKYTDADGICFNCLLQQLTSAAV
jgi:ParB family chromosome partitioning protein